MKAFNADVYNDKQLGVFYAIQQDVIFHAYGCCLYAILVHYLNILKLGYIFDKVYGIFIKTELQAPTSFNFSFKIIQLLLIWVRHIPGIPIA